MRPRGRGAVCPLRGAAPRRHAALWRVRSDELVMCPATFAGSLTRDHAARCRVLGRIHRRTMDTPCVLASLGAHDPESGRRYRAHHWPGEHEQEGNRPEEKARKFRRVGSAEKVANDVRLIELRVRLWSLPTFSTKANGEVPDAQSRPRSCRC